MPRDDGRPVPRDFRWTHVRLLIRPKWVLLAVLLATASVFQAQVSGDNLQSEGQRSAIRGTVINAVTGAPVSRALVSSPDNRRAMLTDSEGHFEFTIPRVDSGAQPGFNGGLFELQARKPGFVDDPNYRRQAEQTPSGDLTITIPLLPEALIKGRVMLSETDPVLGITVQIFSRQVHEGSPKWVPTGIARANSNGEFRFAELLPGTYKLVTAELTDNDPATTVPGGQEYGFPPVYYPGVADFDAAGVIQLTAGETVQADIPVTRQPYFPVKIPVANADPSSNLDVTVSVQGKSGSVYALGYNPAEQRIEGSLPSGKYVVGGVATGQHSTNGEVHLTVSGAPAEGPSLTLTPSSSITVDVIEQFAATEGNGSAIIRSGGGRSFHLHGPRLYLQISAESADDFRQGMASLRPPMGPNDDSLVLENLAPGRYWLQLHSSRGYVAAATTGGVDLLREPLAVTSGSSAPIEVTMRDDTAELEGTVSGMSARAALAEATPTSTFPQQQAWVYCVPLPDSRGQFQQVWVSSDGKFTAAAMAPGAYRVLAFKNQQLDLPYRDANAIRAYDTMGQVVHLSAGEKTNVQLQIIPSTE